MITKDKIDIYFLYKGDFDRYYLIKKKHKKILQENDVPIIENLIQELKWVVKGQASIEYSSQVEESVKKIFDSVETINYLKDLIIKTENI